MLKFVNISAYYEWYACLFLLLKAPKPLLLSGTLHGTSFACACLPLTNRRAARRLVKGRQKQEKDGPCRGPVNVRAPVICNEPQRPRTPYFY